MARRNYRGNSQSSLNFSNSITDEDLGFCKLLEKDGKDISLCGEKTRKRDFHYCRDCYSIIAEIWNQVQEDQIYIPIHNQVLNWGMKKNIQFDVQPEDQPHFKYLTFKM